MRGWSQDAGHISQLLHPRDRGIPEDGPAGRYATVLRASQVLAHVAHLLRPGLEHYQERPAKDGGGRVRLPLKMRQGNERVRYEKNLCRALPCKKKKRERKRRRSNRGIETASPDSVRQIGPETVRTPRDSSRARNGKPGSRKSIERCANDTRMVVRARVVSRR